TVNLIFGLPPLNHYDAAATDLSDLFTGEPDFTPYNFKTILFATKVSPEWLALTKNIDFRRPDADEVKLVSCVRSSMREAGDARQKFVSRFMPHEGPRRFIGDGQVALDGGHELAGAAVHATADLFVGQFDKPAFDEVQPRGARRGEVDVVARALGEPAPN